MTKKFALSGTLLLYASCGNPCPEFPSLQPGVYEGVFDTQDAQEMGVNSPAIFTIDEGVVTMRYTDTEGNVWEVDYVRDE